MGTMAKGSRLADGAATAMSSSNTIICILIGCLGIVACKMNQKEALMACLILALSNLFGQALQLLTSLWSMLKSIECSTLCSCGGAIGYLISLVTLLFWPGLAAGVNVALRCLMEVCISLCLDNNLQKYS